MNTLHNLAVKWALQDENRIREYRSRVVRIGNHTSYRAADQWLAEQYELAMK